MRRSRRGCAAAAGRSRRWPPPPRARGWRRNASTSRSRSSSGSRASSGSPRGRPLPRAEHVVASGAGRWDTGRMAISGTTEAESQRAAVALLQIATLIAREAPEEVLFATVAEHAARRLGTEAGSVLRYVGDERAVVVGVWRDGGGRRLPVNAEIDF